MIAQKITRLPPNFDTKRLFILFLFQQKYQERASVTARQINESTMEGNCGPTAAPFTIDTYSKIDICSKHIFLQNVTKLKRGL
jgi:hypothetical protein